jgi:hypothetical protein
MPNTITFPTIADLTALETRIAAVEKALATPAPVVTPPPVTVPPPAASGMLIALNCHIDFGFWGMTPPYANTAGFVGALKYLWGSKPPLLRDFPNEDQDLARWQAIHDATGAKFIAAINEASPSDQEAMLNRFPAFAAAGLLAAIEGGNEEDDSYPAGLGATLADTADRQKRVWAMGQRLKLPVVNMSFGAGWTAANNWQGNYGAVGDLSAYCDYANAHTYVQPGQDIPTAVQRLNGLAKLAAHSRPVWITEIGWTTADVPNEPQRAQLLVQSIAAAKAAGSGLWGWYAAVDDGSGTWGLFNNDWSPRASATALRDYIAAT